MKKSLTIAIPLFNEEEGIENLYNELSSEIENMQKYVDLEVILVNDGSTDKTEDLLEKFFVDNIYEIITHEKNLNLDGFLRTSIDRCSTDYIAFLDSDCTYSPRLITEFLLADICKFELQTKSGFSILTELIVNSNPLF